MSLGTRLAVAAGVVLLFGAVAVTFIPASPSGATCGNWVAPEWDEDTVQELLDKYESIHDDARRMGRPEIADEAVAQATGVARAHEVCSDALSTRRAIALVLVALALVVPVAVLFVTGGRRRSVDESAAR